MPAILRHGQLLGVVVALQLGCVRAGFDSESDADSDAGTRPRADLAVTAGESGPTDGGPGEAADMARVGGELAAWLTLEGQRNGYLQLLLLDERMAVRSGSAAIPLPPGVAVRGLAADREGHLLLGDGFVPQLIRLDLSADGRSIVLPPAILDPAPLRRVHGVCTLPGGSLVAGEFTTGASNLVVEFSASTTALTPLSTVRATSPPSHTLSHCQAASDDDLLLTEYDGTRDRNGDIARVARNSSGDWIEVQRFDVSAFDQALDGRDDASAIYSFVLHSDGFLYAFPLRRTGERLKRLIRCPAEDISHDQCEQLAALPPDTATTDAIQGAAELPGGDLLFATGRGLYRFVLAEERYELLYDFGRLALVDEGGADAIVLVRGLVLLR